MESLLKDCIRDCMKSTVPLESPLPQDIDLFMPRCPKRYGDYSSRIAMQILRVSTDCSLSPEQLSSLLSDKLNRLFDINNPYTLTPTIDKPTKHNTVGVVVFRLSCKSRSRGFINFFLNYIDNQIPNMPNTVSQTDANNIRATTADNLPTISLTPIGVVHSCFGSKFGTPRQGSLVPSSRGVIELYKQHQPESLDGLSDFSHLWIIFIFDRSEQIFNAKIRPPKLEGGDRRGVFSTRSPHSGLDVVDKTPVVDIKPYHTLDQITYIIPQQQTHQQPHQQQTQQQHTRQQQQQQTQQQQHKKDCLEDTAITSTAARRISVEEEFVKQTQDEQIRRGSDDKLFVAPEWTKPISRDGGGGGHLTDQHKQVVLFSRRFCLSLLRLNNKKLRKQEKEEEEGEEDVGDNLCSTEHKNYNDEKKMLELSEVLIFIKNKNENILSTKTTTTAGEEKVGIEKKQNGDAGDDVVCCVDDIVDGVLAIKANRFGGQAPFKFFESDEVFLSAIVECLALDPRPAAHQRRPLPNSSPQHACVYYYDLDNFEIEYSIDTHNNSSSTTSGTTTLTTTPTITAPPTTTPTTTTTTATTTTTTTIIVRDIIVLLH
eukprot:GHVS01091128.1.p1 GENE.GHVS01091128.1~~GHVS01091128.1.p1  ORF type:complete len:598 (+),score=152.35 GHVS01091128.1:459-2252(+)